MVISAMAAADHAPVSAPVSAEPAPAEPAPAEPAPVSAVGALTASARWWIWGFLAVFTVHDGEEVLATLRIGHLRSIGSPLTVPQALAAICFEWGLFWLVAVLAVWSGRPSWQMRLFGLVVCGYTMHGLAHVAIGVVHDGYDFGVITATAMVVIYGCLALRRLHADRSLRGRDILFGCLASAVLLVPYILSIHAIGRILA